MALSDEFDRLTEALARTVAKELADSKDIIKRLTEEHAAKIGELRSLRETYRKQMADSIRREISAARAIDREASDELRREIDAIRRQLAASSREEYRAGGK
ncbi:hypothetical protein [Ensifer canadensis]|uniref:hypothetical protein n=1 Tax=Ensifer canadensis TaxID=555315 RepID=UPI0035E3CA26